MSLSTRPSLTPHSKLFRILPALCVGSIAWGLGVCSAFQAIDGVIYDELLRFRAARIVEPSRVLLLEVGDDDLAGGAADLELLLSRLKDLGARQILFSSLPKNAPDSFFGAAESMGNVVIGVHLVPDAVDPSLYLPDLPAGLARRSGIPTGLVQNPVASSGVCRARQAIAQVADLPYPFLETTAARRLLGEESDLPTAPYRVDFRGGQGSLPNAPARRLLAGDLIEELVRDRCVLVGMKVPATGSGFFTPTTMGQQTMQLLEYEGHALDTLLRGSVIQELGPGIRLGIVIAWMLVSVACLGRVSIRVSLWVICGLVALSGLASAVALVLFRTWVPATECSFALGAVFLVTVRARALLLTGSLTSLISDSASHLRDKYWPVHTHGTSTSWTLVANMINQTLDLKRLIFLEADPRTARLQEILALHCSLKDIAEMRRDYTRPPYRDAINAKGPIVVENFLSTPDKSEKQYLIPLSFCGDLLGFWAIGMDAAKVAAIPELDSLLLDYTTRISELLHHAKNVSQAPTPGAPVKVGYSVEGAAASQNNLSSTLSLLQQRLGALDVLINNLNSGVIVFDIFGRILQINENMLSLLKKENLVPFEMTALDIIMALSDYDISKARKLLRRVIVENSQVSFPVAFRTLPGNRFLFHLKPLLDASRKDEKSRLKQMGAKSILCELVETTSMAILYEMKSKLTDKLCMQLRNDLAPIDLSWSMLGSGLIPPGEHEAMAEMIQAKVRQAVETLSECQQFLALDADLDELERFPVDPKGPLAMALEEMQAELTKRSLSFQVLEPNFVSYVFASATRLKELFKAILAALVQDASESSTILVRVLDSDGVVAFDFSNMGFGIPNELLQQYIFGEQAVASMELQTIQSGAKWVQAWGGMLEAFSGVGVGMHFTVHLVKFL